MDIPPLGREQVERFWSKVKKGSPTSCWEWKGATINRGYGSMGWRQKDGRLATFLAHRISYFLEFGEQPNVCCHHCDNPSCVNPAHLFNGTQADNAKDRDSKGRGGGDKRRGGNNGRHTKPERTCRGERWYAAHMNPKVAEKRRQGILRHYQDHPEQNRGENNAKAKLTEAEVKEIRLSYSRKQESSLKLAARFGVSKQTILSIIHRKLWPHVE